MDRRNSEPADLTLQNPTFSPFLRLLKLCLEKSVNGKNKMNKSYCLTATGSQPPSQHTVLKIRLDMKAAGGPYVGQSMKANRPFFPSTLTVKCCINFSSGSGEYFCCSFGIAPHHSMGGGVIPEYWLFQKKLAFN